MPAPTVEDCAYYLAASGMTSWSDEEIAAALAAEGAAQAAKCLVPAANAPWPPDLAEALRRRVARNLAMRKLPLGVAMTDIASTRITGQDVETARLESPYRKWVVA